MAEMGVVDRSCLKAPIFAEPSGLTDAEGSVLRLRDTKEVTA